MMGRESSTTRLDEIIETASRRAYCDDPTCDCPNPNLGPIRAACHEVAKAVLNEADRFASARGQGDVTKAFMLHIARAAKGGSNG